MTDEKKGTFPPEDDTIPQGGKAKLGRAFARVSVTSQDAVVRAEELLAKVSSLPPSQPPEDAPETPEEPSPEEALPELDETVLVALEALPEGTPVVMEKRFSILLPPAAKKVPRPDPKR